MAHQRGAWLAVLTAALLALVTALAASAQEPPSERAGLLVQYGDGSVESHCVALAESSITGYDLLSRSGLAHVVAQVPGQGTAICRIGPDGCDAAACLTCQQPSYWSYWTLRDGTWAYAQVGAPSRPVRHGDVDGWAWPGTRPPPATSFEAICGEVAEAPVTAMTTAESDVVMPATSGETGLTAGHFAFGALALALILLQLRRVRRVG